MNIFVLDRDPTVAAAMHCDKHVIKMSIEYAQILSTVHHRWSTPQISMLYKATHKNHPATRWAGDHLNHYDWLYALACATWDEYTYRYGKVHASSRLRDALSQRPVIIHPWVTHDQSTYSVSVPLSVPPPQCMPSIFKTHGGTWEETIASYHRYYREVKYSFASWKIRPIPEWFAENIDEAGYGHGI